MSEACPLCSAPVDDVDARGLRINALARAGAAVVDAEGRLELATKKKDKRPDLWAAAAEALAEARAKHQELVVRYEGTLHPALGAAHLRERP